VFFEVPIKDIALIFFHSGKTTTKTLAEGSTKSKRIAPPDIGSFSLGCEAPVFWCGCDEPPRVCRRLQSL